jgi:hypothetical protein
VLVVGSTLLFAVGWAKLEAVVKPLSDSIMDKLKYVSMPDHSGKIGYQHAVRRRRPEIHVRGCHVGWLCAHVGPHGLDCLQCVQVQQIPACSHTPPPHQQQVIKDLQHLQDELAQPWGWRRALRGLFVCVMCLPLVMWTVLRYCVCCACCTEAPQRSAQRALDVEQPADHRRRLRPPKLVVFIDDLDRVPPLKVAEIIAAINLVLAARRAYLQACTHHAKQGSPASMGCTHGAENPLPPMRAP